MFYSRIRLRPLISFKASIMLGSKMMIILSIPILCLNPEFLKKNVCGNPYKVLWRYVWEPHYSWKTKISISIWLFWRHKSPIMHDSKYFFLSLSQLFRSSRIWQHILKCQSSRNTCRMPTDSVEKLWFNPSEWGFSGWPIHWI